MLLPARTILTHTHTPSPSPAHPCEGPHALQELPRKPAHGRRPASQHTCQRGGCKRQLQRRPTPAGPPPRRRVRQHPRTHICAPGGSGGWACGGQGTAVAATRSKGRDRAAAVAELVPSARRQPPPPQPISTRVGAMTRMTGTAARSRAAGAAEGAPARAPRGQMDAGALARARPARRGDGEPSAF